MAKRTNKITVSKCSIEFIDGKCWVTEHKKESDERYALEELLEDFVGVENISMAIGTDKEI